MHLDISSAEFGFAGVLAALLAAMWVGGRSVRQEGQPVSSGRGLVLAVLYATLFATFAAPPPASFVVFGVLGAIAAAEILNACGITRRQRSGMVVHTITQLAALAAPWGLVRSHFAVGIIATAALVLAGTVLAFGAARTPTPHRWAWMFVLPAVIALNAFSALRALPAGGRLCLHVFFLINVADTAAFFCGKQFGRHRLAPAISPGKTIEGSVGSLVVTLAIALGFARVLALPLSRNEVLVSAALINLLAQAGDLLASLLKRRLAIKDYGSLLRGHGGVLDRFDSCLLAAPAFLVWFTSLR